MNPEEIKMNRELNDLQEVYLKIIHLLVNIDGMFDHGAATQYGLLNYIAKYSLANDTYYISKLARSLVFGKEPFARKKSFPKSSKIDPVRTFTFEHPIPVNQIRNFLITTDRSIDSIRKILDATNYVVVLTQSENKSIKLKTKMPDLWAIGDNPFIRYENTKIVLDGTVELKGAIVR
jgi:hypothetical protein